jgi:L-iditol 2-dehydrogenase
MRVARYIGAGEIAIVEEPVPACPEGGLLVRTEASGLCSGELMAWYMDRKIPHVLGHEVAGRVIESQDVSFPVGSRIFPHHHAPCMTCEFCRSGRHVHCEQWKRTKLIPGGMADFFGVPAQNLSDTWIVDDLLPEDAALIEPLACVVKSLRLSGQGAKPAVIGLGIMGLLHLAMLPEGTPGVDLNPDRVAFAKAKGLNGIPSLEGTRADCVFVCPGTQAAFDAALSIVEPEGTVVMFAPLGPSGQLNVPQGVYFRDVRIVSSYSCGPIDTAGAIEAIRRGSVRAEQVCSHFIELEELPERYNQMKAGRIVKPMVIWR